MISCVYCGGTHARPSEVKQCWAAQSAPSANPRTAEVAPPSAPSAAPALPIGWEWRQRGPAVLGRNVVVRAGADIPAEWADAPRVAIDRAALDAPEAAVRALRAAAAGGVGHVIELADVDFARDRPPAASIDAPLHELGPTFTLWLDELHHFVWSHAVDATTSPPHPVSPSPGDAQLPDGTPVWVDGGPLRYHAPIDGVPVVHHWSFASGAPAPPHNASAAELAPDQLAAVTHTGGTARIIAPAGSGKTRVLTERVRHLVTAWHVPVEALTVVAYNKRAQEEIVTRTADLPGLRVRTLNALALAVVNGRPPFAAQANTWRTDEHVARRVLQELVRTPAQLNVDPYAPWLDALSATRLGLADPMAIEAGFQSAVTGFGEVFPRVRQRFAELNTFDFDEQLVRAIELLLADPIARAAAQRACRVMLVDEFQDLTPAHLLFVRLLAGPGGAVFGVGDDDQTIYGYNGADPRWLIGFDEWFPGAGSHPLEVNYRCPPDIVEAADRLLRHNRRRVAKTIRADRPFAGRGWSAETTDDPVASTARAVRGALDAGAEPGEVAVLSRVNVALAPVRVALGLAGVPVRAGDDGLLGTAAARATLAWLRLATASAFAPADLDEALKRPSRGLHPRVREWATERRDPAGLRQLAGRLNKPKEATALGAFADAVERVRRLARTSPTERVVGAIVSEIGLGAAVGKLDTGKLGTNAPAQSDALTALTQLARLQPDVHAFEHWLVEQLGRPADPRGVTLATVHRVKGQEWPYVVIHLADADQFPHRLADDVEEERRLFHVALTRAGRRATIVSGDAPSPFVEELTTEPSALVEPQPKPAAAPVRRPAPATPFSAGEVYVVRGLVLVDQGQEWTVHDIEPNAAVTVRNGATRKFALGAKVTTAGRWSGALAARPGALPESAVRAYDRLRAWRTLVADGKPAYTVFDDKTLAAIATAAPADLGELAEVKGVGPAKLERFGADVIGILAEARADPAHSAGA